MRAPLRELGRSRPAKLHLGTWVRRGVPRGCSDDTRSTNTPSYRQSTNRKRNHPLVPINIDHHPAGTTTSKDHSPVQFHCLRMSRSSGPSFPHTCASGALDSPKLACRTAITKINRFTKEQSRTQGFKTRMSGRGLCSPSSSLAISERGLLPAHSDPTHSLSMFPARREPHTLEDCIHPSRGPPNRRR